MFAAPRVIALNGAETARTPLLVPSFSSKGFPRVGQIIATMSEKLVGPLLVSAYDVHHKHVAPKKLTFPEMIFLDSGGYEASRDSDFSELGYHPHTPAAWTTKDHERVVQRWSPTLPTVLISYDHPRLRQPIRAQIQSAKKLFDKFPQRIREILIKPEGKGDKYINVAAVVANAKQLSQFDIVGVTEKELGNSLLARMVAISRIREALTKTGRDIPLHVFGSLDTVTTPLYFISGADVFDGLTWLRFAFRDGTTMYQHASGALSYELDARDEFVAARIWTDNYYYMARLTLEMKRYLNAGDLGAFSFHGDFLKRAFESLAAARKEA